MCVHGNVTVWLGADGVDNEESAVSVTGSLGCRSDSRRWGKVQSNRYRSNRHHRKGPIRQGGRGNHCDQAVDFR